MFNIFCSNPEFHNLNNSKYSEISLSVASSLLSISDDKKLNLSFCLKSIISTLLLPYIRVTNECGRNVDFKAIDLPW